MPVTPESLAANRLAVSPALMLGGLIFVTLCLAGLDTAFGSRPISATTILQALWQFDPDQFDHQILRRIRLPHMATAACAGAALGVCGVLLQSVLRNPLGEPHILGLNSGATLAVVATGMVPMGLLSSANARPVVAAIGGGLVFCAVLGLASAGRTGLTMAKVTFCGIALSALASTVTSALLLLDDDTLSMLRYWLVGDVSGGTLEALRASTPILLLGLGLALSVAHRLNILALGDAMATGLGIPVRQTRAICLIAAALLCGGAVALCGPIGFVGLIVPIMARRLSAGNHCWALPMAICLGASLLLLADLAARTLFQPHELATGLMTAFVGAPVFIGLVARMIR